MGYAEDYRLNFNEVLDRRGTTVGIITNAGSYNAADYDILFRSGESIQHVLAMVQPIGNQEADFVAQGRLLQGDKKAYIAGSVTVNTDSTFIVPSGGSYYDVVGGGIETWNLSGLEIYKKCFIRFSSTGSRALNTDDTLW